MRFKKYLFLLLLTISVYFSNIAYCTELINKTKFPDYAELYLGQDKLEKLNRKVFNFNLKLNSYILKPIHILWASVMPQYGMERINGITKNIEYPIRLISTIIQHDFKSAKTETIRFLTNSTIGLGGMFNPAERIFKISGVDENMEQALAKCKVKQGMYMVVPVLNSTTPRNMCGKLLDSIFNPSSYIGTPLIAAVKAVLTINKTYYMQPLVQMLESNFADTYDIAKKFYGLENYIKCSNYDRLHIVKKWIVENNQNNNLVAKNENKETVNDNIVSVSNNENILQGSAESTEIFLHNQKGEDDGIKLKADIELSNFHPQSPVIDSMRTAIFDISGKEKSIWTDLSVWNRNFYKQLKIGTINIYSDRPDYKFRYILQKSKKSPVVVIYPSIGDGSMSMHAANFGKMFYNKGYSVIIMSSHFNWEFVKSMPKNYFPGNPTVDVDYVKETTDKIISTLEKKYNSKFCSKTTIGTSFGAIMTLFMAEKEYSKDTRNKYIAICPPIELMYAMKQVDKISEDWKNSPDTIKDDIALTAEKIIEISNINNLKNVSITNLPFSEHEAKLITGFLLHQKLSDLIYSKEEIKNKPELYNKISKTNYYDYANKYLVKDRYKIEDLEKNSSLHKLSTYFMNAENYKIYHSLDDYLTNEKQLKQLKLYTGTKSVYFSNGAHLGFLYRKEFLDELKNNI